MRNLSQPDPEDSHRTCSECGADCFPEPFEAGNGFRIAFVCPVHGVHGVVDPFADDRTIGEGS